MNKIKLILLLLLAFSTVAKTQNLAKSYYFYNPQLYNPSFIGIETHTEAKIGTQKIQGQSSSAPSVYYGYLTGSFKGRTRSQRGKTVKYKSPYNIDRLAAEIPNSPNGIRLSNPELVEKYKKDSISKAVRTMDRANRNRLKQRLQEKKFDATFRHGMGISVFQQNASPFSSTRLAGQYAMHLPVSRQWILSAGGSLSYIFTQFSSEDLLIENVADPVYERYLGGDYNFNYLGFSGGMSLYSERFIMSYAFQNLYVNHGDDTSQDFFQTYESQLHHLSMFYTAEVNAEMQLQLGVNASIGSLANDRTQGSLKAIYKERLGISTAYDSNDILIPGVFAFISRNFRVNYLADIPLESSIGENQISHEISLQFLIKPGASPTPYFY